jgi:hypothetical protein
MRPWLFTKLSAH